MIELLYITGNAAVKAVAKRAVKPAVHQSVLLAMKVQNLHPMMPIETKGDVNYAVPSSQDIISIYMDPKQTIRNRRNQ